MLTKNIFYESFNIKKNKFSLNSSTKNFNLDKLTQKFPFLDSFTSKYKYSFKKKKLKNFKKYSEFNLIGMGGSILGSEAIYDFLNYKIKKGFIFLTIYKIIKI